MKCINRVLIDSLLIFDWWGNSLSHFDSAQYDNEFLKMTLTYFPRWVIHLFVVSPSLKLINHFCYDEVRGYIQEFPAHVKNSVNCHDEGHVLHRQADLVENHHHHHKGSARQRRHADTQRYNGNF